MNLHFLHNLFYILLIFGTVSLIFNYFYSFKLGSILWIVTYNNWEVDEVKNSSRNSKHSKYNIQNYSRIFEPSLFNEVQNYSKKSESLILNNIQNSSRSFDPDYSVAVSTKGTTINPYRDNPISCSSLFNGDKNELERSFEYLKQHPKTSISASEYSTQTCSFLLSDGRYVLWPTSPEEDAFSLAFSIVMYRDVEQFERLLRAIYRPQNLLCVHVDSKAPEALWNAINHIAECLNYQFNNIIITNSRVNPQWGEYSVLKADLNCMRELLEARDRRKWRYFINLTGQEYPLRTHLELVRILSLLDGANLMEAVPFANPERLRNLKRIPKGVHMYKGAVHIVVSFGFVNFTLTDPRAARLLDYVREDTIVPDEWYFSTLNHNPDVLPAPGAPLAASNGHLIQTNAQLYPYLNRIKGWEYGEFPCRCASSPFASFVVVR